MQELIEFIVKSVVSNKDAVSVSADKTSKCTFYTVNVAQSDLGAVIGKGGKITIWMPAELAFGEDGNRFMGPNEALQMNIELLDVETPNVQVQSIEWDTPAEKDKK